MTFIKKNNSIQNIKSNIDTSVTPQTANTSYAEVDGSSIEYTPANDATFVAYEFIFTSRSSTDNHHNIYLALVYDDGGGENTFDYYSIHDGYNDGHYNNKARFIIPTYTGSRTWKLKFRSNNTSSWWPRLHEDEDNNVYYPSVLMYSIV